MTRCSGGGRVSPVGSAVAPSVDRRGSARQKRPSAQWAAPWSARSSVPSSVRWSAPSSVRSSARWSVRWSAPSSVRWSAPSSARWSAPASPCLLRRRSARHLRSPAPRRCRSGAPCGVRAAFASSSPPWLPVSSFSFVSGPPALLRACGRFKPSLHHERSRAGSATPLSVHRPVAENHARERRLLQLFPSTKSLPPPLEHYRGLPAPRPVENNGDIIRWNTRKATPPDSLNYPANASLGPIRHSLPHQAAARHRRSGRRVWLNICTAVPHARRGTTEREMPGAAGQRTARYRPLPPRPPPSTQPRPCFPSPRGRRGPRPDWVSPAGGVQGTRPTSSASGAVPEAVFIADALVARIPQCKNIRHTLSRREP